MFWFVRLKVFRLLYTKYVWTLLLVSVKSHFAGVRLINFLSYILGFFSTQSETYYSRETGFNHAM